MNNDEQDPKENPWMKSMLIWAGVIVALLLTVSMFGAGSSADAGSAMSYSSFRDKVEEGSVKSVSIAPDKITGEMTNGDKFSTTPIGNDPSLVKMLDEKGVEYSGKAEEQPSIWRYLLQQDSPGVGISLNRRERSLEMGQFDMTVLKCEIGAVGVRVVRTENRLATGERFAGASIGSK